MSFDKAYEFTIQNEGKTFTDDPTDRGGATKFGITQNALTRYRARATTADDVKNLQEDEAKQIYKDHYWKEINGDNIPNEKCAIALFDMAVNMGPTAAVKIAQTSLHLVNDGVAGPKTCVALSTDAFLSGFMAGIADRYVEICISNPTQLKYLKGWIRRAIRLSSLL